MPELARALGKGYGEFRRAFDEMKRNVETDFQTDEIRRSLLDLPPRPTPVAFAAAGIPAHRQPAAAADGRPSPLPRGDGRFPAPAGAAGIAPAPEPGPPPGQAHG